MTDRELALSNLLNHQYYSERFLKIVTKSGNLQPLQFNVFQKEAHEAIKEARKNNRPFRGIWLKCRQVGLSTYGSAYNYHQSATRFHHRGTIIAHDQASTNNLFNMCKRFRDYSSEEIRPMTRYSNEKAIVFDNPDDATRGSNPGLGSSINVENANNLTAGRSATTQTLHISELAFWSKASIVLTGLLQSVPYEAGTSIIIESTANGIAGDGEEFYRRCMAAMKGESNFQFFFCKWTKEQGYEMDPMPGFKLTEYEQELLKLHPELNLRKLAWRRYKIENEMGSTLIAPEDQFKQEYPLTPEEAFISSGRPVFNLERVHADIERARGITCKRGDITAGRISENIRGNFRIYKESSGDKRYAIGADVAEGLERGDFSTMTVLDQNLEQVASYHNHVHPDLFGAEMIKMGMLYNEALLAPEVNNHGLTTLTHINNKSYRFIYMREVFDERTNQHTKKAGWQTNIKTKILMLDEFVAAYRENQIKINDIELLQEMATLTLNPDGSVDLNGKDRVVSICIALQAVKQLPKGEIGAFEASDNKQRFATMEEMLRAGETEEESYFD